MLPSFLRSERVPYASVTIVRERAEFHALITHPDTGRRLDAMLADNAAVDAAIEAERENDRDDECQGDACGAGCGYCGRCS